MAALIFLLLNLGASIFKSKSRLEAENAALRQQLIVLQRKLRGRVQFKNSERLIFIQLYRWWQNSFAERLIGSIRRECVDHVVVLGQAHLRRILTKYAAYYNRLRTHRSLDKDAPVHRAIQHAGCIVSAPVLGGLHHHYYRI
jgi:integrase-like protein